MEAKIRCLRVAAIVAGVLLAVVASWYGIQCYRQIAEAEESLERLSEQVAVEVMPKLARVEAVAAELARRIAGACRPVWFFC